uniref:Uncharacterized protein LOC117357752 n=1 Tax=Geotrypetes seraphini TaxID=260995 RepID=A0A6P8R7L2_GEOSA|nr:uncharacterized protein LOC117357752 [Geotrypetes seraphini]
MNNCDLEKFAISGGKLEPPFQPDLTSYKSTVASNVVKINLNLLTADSGASYNILGGDGSRVITLKEGINTICVEVTAEDGTIKKYVLEVTKLSANCASLQGLKLSDDIQLLPLFVSNVYEYSCTVPYYLTNISIQASISDSQMKVTVNGTDALKPVSLCTGDTLIEVQVFSPDGTKSQVYQVLVTRLQLPCFISFTNVSDQMEYECPVSLTAFYRPVSVRGSDPRHTFSAPYIDLLTRRSKVDPLDETLLGENWRLPEYELDMKMSRATVHCCYAYRGCSSILKLSELGLHVKDCTCKPSSALDTKDITESKWYKEHVASVQKTDHRVKHVIQERNWEKKLQQVFGETSADKLCTQAEEQINLYRQKLPKPGDVYSYEEQLLPLDALHQAAIVYASAIKLKPKDANLHFKLGLVLEEHYYAAEIHGLKKKREEMEELSSAKAMGKQEEILAICKLHGFPGHPNLQQQLKALDLEFHQLKDQGQSGKADYIQTLFAWKSKQAGKTGAVSLDEESPMAQALLKYLDALFLNPDNWQYNFHVGRLKLLQGENKEALTYLQTSLALRPASPVTRVYTGLALMEQEDDSAERTNEALIYLQQGLDHLLNELFILSESSIVLKAENSFSIMNVQLLKGFLKISTILRKLSVKPTNFNLTAVQTLHMITDWSAKALCQCLQKGDIAQEIEWILLKASFNLLEILVQEDSYKEDWISKRCQALSALIRLTSIPACKELLNMQEKVCQLGVFASPCNSNALYLLGLAQLAQYDNNSQSENALCALQDAKLSFNACISLENMPTKGPVKQEITNQKWWQDWKAAEDEKAQKKSKEFEEMRAATQGTIRGKGTALAPARGSPTAATPRSTVPSMRGSNITRARNPTRVVSTATTRGRGTTGTLAETKNGIQSSSTSAETPAAPETEVKSVTAKDSSSYPVHINRVSYVHRLGLARALSRTNETIADACHLYEEVIVMAPEVHDAYIELADLLIKTDAVAAVDVYSKYPQKPIQDQSFDDAYITGEIVRLLIKHERYDDPRLATNMIAYGKVMGIGCLEKYMTILEEKFKTNILKTVYAGIHGKPMNDPELQNFFRFKCWI